jgi:hypothetical protein
MKTPEELAEELDRQAVLYVSLKARNDVSYYVGMDCYKAGYQAAAPQWISVKDRLPEYDQLNLLWHKDFKQQFVGRRVDSNAMLPVFYWQCSEDFFEAWEASTFPRLCNEEDITHWMPIPKPPEE